MRSKPNTTDAQAQTLVQTVHHLAQAAGLPMPEVGIFESDAPNAFATGPTKSRALVAVSTGLLRRMDRPEIEGVLGRRLDGKPPRPMSIAEVQESVSRLVGMPLNGSSRAVDMEMFDFGDLRPHEDRHGREYLRGDTALHVQAPWRIVDGDRIVLGYNDYWDPPSGVSREGFDPSEGHPSRRDELLAAWFADRPTQRLVAAATAHPSGDLRIDFDDGTAIEILPMSIADDDEFWRLFERWGPHIVVGGRGMERSGD
jgi:hypothetical protein